jgi:hypothetical protein
MAYAGFPPPVSAGLEDLASAVLPVLADHHPTGSGRDRVTAYIAARLPKSEGPSVAIGPTAPLTIAFITGHPAGPAAADQDPASRPAGSYPGRDRRYARSGRWPAVPCLKEGWPASQRNGHRSACMPQ